MKTYTSDDVIKEMWKFSKDLVLLQLRDLVAIFNDYKKQNIKEIEINDVIKIITSRIEQVKKL